VWETQVQGFASAPAARAWTIEVMAELARGAAVRPDWRALALQVARACPPNDGKCLADAAWSWLRGRLIYLRDPPHAELVADPSFTVAAGGGDCDDLAVAVAALLLALGLRAGYVPGVLLSSGTPHILTAVDLGGRWYPCDLAGAYLAPGQWPPTFRADAVLPLA